MKRVAVVILNWNGKKFLEKFIPGVIAHAPDYTEVIVADNASGDDSIAWLEKNHPSVRIIRNLSNGGYAKGYNDALSGLGHEYFVLLNSDVEVTANWIDPLIRMMDADPRIAACQPKILAYHNRTQFEYAGAAGGFIDKYGFPFCRGRIFDTYEEDTGQYNDTKEIFWATGACLFVRSELFRKAGGLDEDFFAHMEEIDLCWRLKNMGYAIMYNPGATVYHVGGGTLSKADPKKTFLNFRNNLVLLFKNHSSQYFLIKILLRMCLDGAAGLRFLFSGDIAHFWAVQRAHFSFYGRLGRTMAKRRAMKKLIARYATSAIYRRSIVLDYYLRGKKNFSELEASKF
ncbi:MAG: glycosyltransferase family 2 protein [Bacteroidota bacterium]